MKTSLVYRCAVFFVAAVLSATAYAQGAIEEIVVQATKRDSTVMDVAASITAFASETLDTREIEGVSDLNVNVPNLYSGVWNGQVLLTIRGVGYAQTHGSADPAVTQHVDGIFLPRTTSLRGAYFDLGTLEVLRGPQGTLYGRNTTGGSVNLVTNKPTEEFEARVGLLYGDYDRVQVNAMVSGPISDKVLGRVSVLFDERDAYTENLMPGFDDPDIEEIASVRGALTFLVNDELTVDLSVHYEEWAGGNLFDSYTAPNDFIFPIYTGAQFDTRAHKAYADVNADDQREDLIIGLSIDWQLSDNVTLTAKTGFVDTDFDQYSDADGTSAPSTNYWSGTDSKTISQEINLRISLMDDRLDLLTGLYYYDDDLDWYNGGDVGFLDDLLGLPIPTLALRTLFLQDTKSAAAYMDATYQVSDAFRLYGGIRYTDEEKETEQHFDFGGFPGGCGFGLTPTSFNSEEWNETSFRLGFEYDVSDQSMLYVQFSEGFRSGGFDSSSCSDPFEPEFNQAWEIGYKATLADGRVELRTAVFSYDYSDLQLAKLNGFQIDVDNVEGADIRGVEIEGQFLVSERLQIAVNYGYLDAEYAEHTDCNTLLFIGNCSAASIIAGTTIFEDVKGNRLNRAPEHTLGVVAEYVVPMDNRGELAFTGQWTYTDDIYYRPFNNDEDKQDSYTISNLFVAYKPSGDSNLTLKLFGKNLTDEKYVGHISASASTSFNFQTGAWGPPRTWGVAATWDF